MRQLIVYFAFVVGAMVASAAASAAAPSRMAVSLIAQSERPAPGKTIMLGLRMDPKPGWHGYWSNPGDSGLPPKVQWTTPPGVTVGALRHPAPQRLEVAGMTSYVHGGEHTLLAPMTVAASHQAGDALHIEGKVELLVCSDSLCVPEKSTVAVDLVVGDGKSSPQSAALIREAQRAIPTRSRSTATYQWAGENIVLTVPDRLGLLPSKATFFPFGDAVFHLRGTKLDANGNLEITGRLRPSSSGAPHGLVGDGRKAAWLNWRSQKMTADVVKPQDTAEGEPTQLETPSVQAAAPSPARKTANLPASPLIGTVGLMAAILGAMLGGILLNLMPCVFPILSLKALHLARAGHSASAARREGIAYAAGATVAALALGGAIFSMREAGVAVGWSFQLQHPPFIFALLILVTAIALNLAGLFHVTAPALDRPVGKFSSASAFGTGAMAAIIATPCNAPFMASAIGAALLFPGWSGLLVFAALGLGLGLPFMVLGWAPRLRVFLPKPGAWMERLQRLLSVPMFATAAGLAWILGRQAGTDAMALGLAAAVAVGLALWWAGLWQRKGTRRLWLPVSAAIVAALGGGALVAAVPPGQAITSAGADTLHQSFSEERLATLRAAGTPVFVDFTADWCLTCKVNEKLAIDRAETQSAFQEAGVVTLVGDWTDGDPAITRFLAAHQRNSIPFYLFYPSGERGQVLPQILTADMLANLAAAGRSAGAAGFSASSRP